MRHDTLHYKVPLPTPHPSLFHWDESLYHEPEWVSLWLARLFAGVIPEPVHVRYRIPRFTHESMYHGEALDGYIRHLAEQQAREKGMTIVYYPAVREVDYFDFVEYSLEAWAVPVRYE